jgi:tetratricopeptide (TPR) repeat protein
MMKDQDAEALASASKAVELSPDDPECLLTLAAMLRVTGRADEALLPTRRALALDPRNWRMRIDAGRTFDTNGDMKGALAQYGQAIHLQPDVVHGYLLAGVTLSYMTGREDDAIRFLQRAAALDPGNLTISRRLLIGYLSIGDDRSAARLLEHLRTTDTNVGYRLSLGRQHYIAGRVAEDRKILLEVLKEAPENGSALYALSMLSSAPEEAEAALNRTLQRYPEFLDKPQYWQSLDSRVCLLAWTGQLDRARALLVQAEPDWKRRNAFSISSIVAERGIEVARSLSCVGRNDEALAELESLLNDGFDLYGWQHIAYDAALKPLHDHPRFKSLLMRLKTAATLERERFRARPNLDDSDIDALGR